ncbi:GyrI-like domain-containing protein [Brevibacterium litoralis]|uniref:GyrI-like domain-containing protein n=1 Tax=Brevibacterium litoralis TaxID=3138935 RepID=UPI0032EE2B60
MSQSDQTTSEPGAAANGTEETGADPRIITVAATPAAVVSGTNVPFADIAGFYDKAYPAIAEVLEHHQLTPIGPAYGLMTRMPTETMDLEVGFALDHALPVARKSAGGVQVEPSSLPGGLVATTTYVGPYEGLGGAWESFMSAIPGTGHTPRMPFWEVYVTEPGPDADPATMRTDLYVSVGPNS